MVVILLLNVKQVFSVGGGALFNIPCTLYGPPNNVHVVPVITMSV